jgi:hypothetical protein
VENHLKRADRGGERRTVLPYHEAVSDSGRKANLTAFLNPVSSPDEMPVVVVRCRPPPPRLPARPFGVQP